MSVVLNIFCFQLVQIIKQQVSNVTSALIFNKSSGKFHIDLKAYVIVNAFKH